MFKNTKAFSGFAVDDLEAAKRFYGDVLGIEVIKESDDMPLLTLNLAGGERPTLVYEKPDHVPAGFTILNFPVDDIAAAVARLKDKGVVFERYEGTPTATDDDGIFRGGGPLIAWFTDPAGNTLAVIEE